MKPVNIKQAKAPNRSLNKAILGFYALIITYHIGIEFTPPELKAKLSSGIINGITVVTGAASYFAGKAEEARSHAGDVYSSAEDGLPDSPEEVIDLINATRKPHV